MAKIRKLNIYPLEIPVSAKDYWIGTQASTGNTVNFSAIQVADYVSQFLGVTPVVSSGLISVDSIVSDSDTVTVENAVYRINGNQYTFSGEIPITPAADGYQRIDIIVGNESEIFIIEGTEVTSNPVQPGLPENCVLIGILTVTDSIEIAPPETAQGWHVYNNLVYLKKSGNTNHDVIEAGDVVVGYMGDNTTFMAFGVYNEGDYFQASSYTPYVSDINQNNKQKFTSFILLGSSPTPLTITEVATLMNGFTTVYADDEVPWVIVSRIGVSPAIKHIYAFKNGKGTYGVEGATVTANMLQYITSQNASTDDLNGANTQTINLGTVTNYITTLNSVSRDFTNENLVYIINYITGGITYNKCFIGGTYGMYGGSNPLQFTTDMWQDISTSASPGIAGVTSVSGASGKITVTNGTTTPIVDIDPAYTSAQNTYADGAASAAATSVGNAKVNLTDVLNALTQTAAGKVLDARQGKVLKDLIDTLTTSVATDLSNKVNITDVLNALTQTAAGKVLDARQGKVLKDLIDALTLVAIVAGSDSTVPLTSISTVAAYPGSPVANRLYFVETSEFYGQVSVSASGTTTINIPHGQSFTPSFFMVSNLSANANGIVSRSIDATNIVLTYASSPATAGTTLTYMVMWRR